MQMAPAVKPFRALAAWLGLMVLAGGISSPAGAVERAAATSSTTTAAESAASGSGSAALASAADADSSRPGRAIQPVSATPALAVLA